MIYSKQNWNLRAGGIDIEHIKIKTGYDSYGLPEDKSYLECGLPAFLQESVSAMQAAWDKLDRGEIYCRWDCDFCNLQADINNAEVNLMISPQQAWYLREKYLRIAKE